MIENDEGNFDFSGNECFLEKFKSGEPLLEKECVNLDGEHRRDDILVKLLYKKKISKEMFVSSPKKVECEAPQSLSLFQRNNLMGVDPVLSGNHCNKKRFITRKKRPNISITDKLNEMYRANLMTRNKRGRGRGKTIVIK